MCLYGEMVRVRIFASIRYIGTSVGICGVTIIWHVSGETHLSFSFDWQYVVLYNIVYGSYV